MTDRIDFEEMVNHPTVVSAVPGSAIRLGEPFWIDLDQRNEVNEPVTSWPLALQLRDDNVLQVLEARWRVVKVGTPAPPFSVYVLPGGLSPVRDLTIDIKLSDLADSQCHLLEFIAASPTSYFRPPNPEQVPGSFDSVLEDREPAPARASWMVLEGPGSADVTPGEKEQLADSCGALAGEDFLQAARVTL